MCVVNNFQTKLKSWTPIVLKNFFSLRVWRPILVLAVLAGCFAAGYRWLSVTDSSNNKAENTSANNTQAPPPTHKANKTRAP